MALTQIDFDEREEKKIEIVSKKYNLNKPKAVRRIVVEHIEDKSK